MTRDGPKDAPTRGELHAALGTASTGHDELRPGTDDLELVRRAELGDRIAFRGLFELYHRRVYQMAVAILRDPQAARDVVQEAFVRIYRHLADLQASSSFYTWLYRISMDLVYDQLRRRKAHTVDDDQTLPRAARSELVSEIQVALDTLPEPHRQVILLREVEGLSYDEIAKIMGVPRATIMSRLFHARREMQRALAGYVASELTPSDQGRA